MKRLLFPLALLCLSSAAHGYQTIFNPFTQKLDYVGASSTGSLSTTNLTVTSSATFNSGFYVAIATVAVANYSMNCYDAIVLASNTVNMTVTLPTAKCATGFKATITKINKSTSTVTINTTGSDLIDSSTGTFIIYGPGQRFEAYSDGGMQWAALLVPQAQHMGGLQNDPNAAAAVNTGNDANCITFQLYDFAIASATWFVVGATAGNTDVGIYDNAGIRITSSGSLTTPGNGVAHLPYTALAYLSPGIYWKCLAGSTVTTLTYTRESIDGILGTCRIASSLPLPTSLTFSGCTVSTRIFTQAVQFLGGPTQ